MPAVTDYREILQEVKESVAHYDTQPYIQVYENSFTFTLHSQVKDKDFLVRVEGVRNTTCKTKTSLHVQVHFQADHCKILHDSQMFCVEKTKHLARFLDNLITAEYSHVLNIVTMSE